MAEIQTIISGSRAQTNDPIHVSINAITRLNTVGERANLRWLDTVDEMREAQQKIPEGKIGVVLGSGDNTQHWKSRGWHTLDIDPNTKAGVIYDANNLRKIFGEGSIDYLYAECINMDVRGINGVSPARLLNQANATLKMGGVFAMETANFENVEHNIPIPNRSVFGEAFAAHGFNVIVELDEYFPAPSAQLQNEFRQQRVVYYGRKVANGYNPARYDT